MGRAGCSLQPIANCVSSITKVTGGWTLSGLRKKVKFYLLGSMILYSFPLCVWVMLLLLDKMYTSPVEKRNNRVDSEHPSQPSRKTLCLEAVTGSSKSSFMHTSSHLFPVPRLFLFRRTLLLTWVIANSLLPGILSLSLFCGLILTQ